MVQAQAAEAQWVVEVRSCVAVLKAIGPWVQLTERRVLLHFGMVVEVTGQGQLVGVDGVKIPPLTAKPPHVRVCVWSGSAPSLSLTEQTSLDLRWCCIVWEASSPRKHQHLVGDKGARSVACCHCNLNHRKGRSDQAHQGNPGDRVGV